MASNSQVPVSIGDVVSVELPYSEACMHMRVAGTIRKIEVRKDGAQILNDDGTRFSFPVTHGEAGIFNTRDGALYVIPTRGHHPVIGA